MRKFAPKYLKGEFVNLENGLERVGCLVAILGIWSSGLVLALFLTMIGLLNHPFFQQLWYGFLGIIGIGFFALMDKIGKGGK